MFDLKSICYHYKVTKIVKLLNKISIQNYMNGHNRQIRKNLIDLVTYADLNPDNIDIDSEIPKWPIKYLDEFVEALPIFERDKLGYILRGIFQKNLVEKLTRSFKLGRDTGDQYSDFNRVILNRMQELGVDINTWASGKISKKLIVNDTENRRHELLIRPVQHTLDAREHLLLGNPHPVEDSCTVARLSNTKVPNVNLDYLLDASVRSITIFSETINDSIGYLRLVAAETEDKKPIPVLGASFMVFIDEFKENPQLLSGILDFLNLNPNFTQKAGFKEIEINYAGDFSKVDSKIEREVSNTLSLLRGRIKELERKRNTHSISPKESEILDQLRESYSVLEKVSEQEIYTKKASRKRFLRKIGLDFFEYSTKWKGATYFDLWGGDNRYYGKTLDSVDGSKGHNYQSVLDLVSKIKIRLKNNTSKT